MNDATSNARRIFAAMILAASALFLLVGCHKSAPSSDPTPPQLYLRTWEQGARGGQGPQLTVQPRGQISLPASWLGKSKADIRIFGDDKEGVRRLSVSGSATGSCSTRAGSEGRISTAPGIASFPARTEVAPPGDVEDFFVIHLDKLLAKASCGTRRAADMPQPQEFFLKSGTWTITATADNCCGGETVDTFKIVIR